MNTKRKYSEPELIIELSLFESKSAISDDNWGEDWNVDTTPIQTGDMSDSESYSYDSSFDADAPGDSWDEFN